MNAEKILTIATQLKNEVTNHNNPAALYILAELIEEARAEINATKARATGKKGIHAAAMRILKSSESTRPILTKAHATPEAVTVSDGFRLVQFHANDAPPVPAWEDEANRALYPAAGLKQVIKDAESNATPATLPDVATLKNYITTEKATRKASGKKQDRRAPILYKLCDGVHVNALYLLDMLEALPNCCARVTCQDFRRSYSPIYFEAPTGCGVLLPVRVSEA